MRFINRRKDMEETGGMFMIRLGVMGFIDNETQPFIQPTNRSR